MRLYSTADERRLHLNNLLFALRQIAAETTVFLDFLLQKICFSLFPHSEFKKTIL
ncbi:MAG: hypothetical protein LBP59_20405 [Planctomycetaceae bacterium]|nr:hypothetical protein [Planctomycetaceae bacterium]